MSGFWYEKPELNEPVYPANSRYVLRALLDWSSGQLVAWLAQALFDATRIPSIPRAC